MTKFIVAIVFVVLHFAVPSQGDLFRERRHDSEIKNRKDDHTIRGKAGIPMVFDHNKKAYIRTGIPELRRPEDVHTTGDSSLRDEDEDMNTDQNSEAGVSKTGDADDDDDDSGDDEESGKQEKDKDKKNPEELGQGYEKIDQNSEAGVSKTGDADDDDDDSGDDEESGKQENDKDKKNPEELGQGYEKIGDMGSNNKDDDHDEKDSQGSKGTGSSDGDIMNTNSADSNKAPDLNGEFPPTADEIKKLPKEKELTAEQVSRKMAKKRKGYVQFTIRQKYSPELKYKESAAYKILAGNVRQDVERALRATGVVRDVLFREAKDIGGPPYRSKVQVFLKVKNVKEKKLKRIVDYGLINGMITVPGSFYAN